MDSGGLATQIGRRMIETVPVLILTSILVFCVLRLVPGDPAAIIAGEDATAEELAVIRAELGLDVPLWAQYFKWLENLATGDFGTSFISSRSVGELIAQKLPATLELSLAAYILAIVIGIPLGIMAGVYPRTPWDYGLSVFTVLGIGIPNFFLGILALLVFSVKLGWLPATGRGDLFSDPVDAIQHLIMPACALGFTFAAILARFTRSSILDTMGEDFIRTARAKGLNNRRVIVHHALRNSLIPLVTVVGLQVGRLLAGALVIEIVFAWPGIGQLIVSSIRDRDYLVVQTLLFFLVGGFIGVNLFVDLAYMVIDPRIRTK
ncbi:ABC transporter permease [Candidatus Entotheonella palauensis]|uniref:ABC transporter permease n=1 Tax=Candidatus Entotheonella palauensis TaxID=93172 RepID=UPI000B7F7EAB|nr:ABC transporter permease [Candidatus Entotheonella palauensis]